MKKIVGLLASAALVLGLGWASPAQAVQTQHACSNDGAVCLYINFSVDPGSTGFNVYWIRLTCDPYHYGIPPIAGWDDIAVDGHVLQIDKYASAVKWERDDAHSNLSVSDGGGQCVRTIDVNGNWPDMNHLYIVWEFTEQLNHQHDIDDAIDMDFINNG